MLTLFPAALPDELLYSRLARYHLLSCSPSPKQTLDDLFGDRSVRASIDLQCHLRALSERVSALSRCTLRDLLRGTLLSYYASYQPSHAGKTARHAMTDGTGDGLHARLGIAAGMRLPPHRLRWCPRCYAEATKLHGEAYWRRAHQLPGVLICPSHGVPLCAARLPKRRCQHEFIAATPRTCVRDERPPPDWAQDPQLIRLLWRLAHDSARLLDHPVTFGDFASLTDHCRRRLIDTCLATPSGRLRLDALADAAGIRLSLLRGLIPEAGSTGWLIAMGRKHRKSFSPLQHLLFGIVVDGSPRVQPPRKIHPGPRHFLADDPEFEARLRRAAVNASGLRDAARQVGVDPRTFLRHAARLQLDGPWTLTPASESKPATDPAPGIRRRWLTALHDSESRTQLRHRLPAEWVWLKRHDPDWLEAHSPAPIPPKGLRQRVDWPALDAELAPDIRQAIATVRAISPPCRVTRSEIERHLGRSGWFGPRLRKLPLCRSLLDTSAETLDDFRLRRIVWAREVLLDHGISPARWRVCRMAGLPKRLSVQITKELRSHSWQPETLSK